MAAVLRDTMATTSAQHEGEAETETAPFMCRKCDRVFAFRSEYDRHMKNRYPCVRPGASRYRCDACMAGFDIKTRYDQHMRTKKHLRKVQANETGECSAGRPAEVSPTPSETIHIEGMRSGIRLSQEGMLSAHDLVMQALDVTEDAAVRLVMNMSTTVTIHVGALSGSDHDDHFLVDALGAALIMRVLGTAGQGFREEFGERLLIAMGADDITKGSLHEPVNYFDDTDDDADDGANIGTDDGANIGTDDGANIGTDDGTDNGSQQDVSDQHGPVNQFGDSDSGANNDTKDDSDHEADCEDPESSLGTVSSSQPSSSQDSFLAFLLERFTDAQKRLFAESYSVYMQDHLQDKFCIDLDEAFKWMGFRRKDIAVRLLLRWLVLNIDYICIRADSFHSKVERSEGFKIKQNADKYMLKPQAFKLLLTNARTPEGAAAKRYFLDIELALLAYTKSRLETETGKQRQNGLALESVTDNKRTDVNCLYFGIPEGSFTKLKTTGPGVSPELAVATRAKWIIIKLGQKKAMTDRTVIHNGKYSGFYLLDCVPTQHMTEVEDRLKKWLRNEGMLFEGVHENKVARDTELLIVASQEQYAQVVQRTKRLVEEITLENEKGSKCHFAVLEKEKEQEKTQQELAKAAQEESRARREESKARKEESRARKEEARARREEEKTAGIKAQVRLAELELQKHARPDAA